jgi:hypothetical protein
MNAHERALDRINETIRSVEAARMKADGADDRTLVRMLTTTLEALYVERKARRAGCATFSR